MTNARISSTQIPVGSLVQLEGVKANFWVIAADGKRLQLQGPRGEIVIEDCGTHWIRWGTSRRVFPRECKLVRVMPPTTSATAEA